MQECEVIVGKQYRYGSPDGPIVEVYSKHEYIPNHFYIKYIEKNSHNSARCEMLFPLEET